MGLMAPLFLAGLLAAGLPVYFHLLRQHKSNPRPFSSLMFFERSTQSSIKHRRLRYLQLLAARLLVLVLLVLAFAGPFIYRTVQGAADGRRLLVLVVDHSFSMRADNRLEQAREAALRTLDGLGAGDQGQAAVLGSRLEFLTPPTSSRDELAAALRTIEAADARSSYGELARALRAIAESERYPLEVHFFTDAQQSSMPPRFADLALPDRVAFRLHPVAGETEANFAVEAVVSPSTVFDPAAATVEATIAGFAAEETTQTVSLAVNSAVQKTTAVTVPAHGRATAKFTGLELPYGFSRCEVRIEGRDQLAADDRYLFAVERADPRPVLFVHRAPGSGDLVYFQAATESAVGAAFRLQPMARSQAEGVDPSRFPVVVLSDPGALPDAFENRLRQYLRSGGALLIAAGAETGKTGRVPVVDTAVQASQYSDRSGERFRSVSYADRAHPAIRSAGRFEGVKFYYTLKVDPSGHRVLARFADETPVLLETVLGEGRALVFTSTFDNVANDFPLQPAFVPFVEQALAYLAGVEGRTRNVAVDSFVELRSQDAPAQGFEVLDPDGNRPFSLEEAATVTDFRVDREGFYEIRKGGNRAQMVAVNADRRESDLSVTPEETLAMWNGDGGAVEADAAGETREPHPLWWYVMLLVLAAAIGESLLASKYLSIDREAA